MSPTVQKITKHMDTMLHVMSSIDGEIANTFQPDALEKVANTVSGVESAFNNTGRVVAGVNGSLNDVNINFNTLQLEADSVTNSVSNWQDKLKTVNSGLDLVKKGIGAVKAVANQAFSYLEAYDVKRSAEMQLELVMKNQGNTLDEYNMILDKASQMQNTTAIGDTAFIGAAAEISNYLTETEAVMAMMDTFADYATGMTGKPSVDAKEAVELAAQLGNVLGGSFDELTKKGFTLTDMQKEIISNGTEMERVAVVADVIGESWDGFAEAMANTPMGTLEQTKNIISNMNAEIGEGLYPAVLRLNQGLLEVLGNGMLEAPIQAITGGFTTIMQLIDRFAPLVLSILNFLSEIYLFVEPLITIIIEVFGLLADGLEWAVNQIGNALDFIQDNILLFIGVLSILGAALLYTLVPAIISTITTLGIKIGMMLGLVVVTNAQALATGAATVAQHGFNTALWASPWTWIIAAIIAVISALIYFSDAAGVVGGIIFTVVTYIAKILLWLATPFVIIAEFVANVFRNPAEAIKMLFINAFNAVLEGLAVLASGIDWTINKFAKFFSWLGLDFGISSDIAGTIRGWKMDIETSDEYISYMDKLDDLQEKMCLDAAFDAGFNTFKDGADNIKDAVSGLLNFGDGHEEKMPEDPWTADDTFGGFAPPSGVGAGAGKLPDVGSVENVGSVDKIKDDVSITEEDLRYLKDIAKLEYVNKYTTAKVELHATFGDVHETADANVILETIQDGMRQSLDNHLRG